MSVFVLDTSALLAIILEEPGAEAALSRVRGAQISAANLTELISRCLDKGIMADVTMAFLASHGVATVTHDAELARMAGVLRTATRDIGSSLGDRACLALAIREGATAVTADRIWATLDLGCKIELIR